MNLAREIAVRRAMSRLAGERLRKRKIPAPRPSAQARLEYQAMLTERLRDFDAFLEREVLPELETWRRLSAAERGIRLDSAADVVQRAFAHYRLLRLGKTKPKKVLEDAADTTAKATARALDEQVQAAAGVAMIVPTKGIVEMIPRWVDRNLDLITSLEDQELAQVADIVQRGVTSGIRVESIRDEILNATDVSKSKAALLARDQTLKLHGQMTQERQQAVGIGSYTWSTSEDERVRPRHRELDGTVHEWSDPPIVDVRTGRRGHPGSGDYLCRCIAIPVFDFE